VRIQRRLFTNPALADAIIRAAALDARLCRLFALVALGERACAATGPSWPGASCWPGCAAGGGEAPRS